jgi:glycosyltransferase involved in cell wall biosynthesis
MMNESGLHVNTRPRPIAPSEGNGVHFRLSAVRAQGPAPEGSGISDEMPDKSVIFIGSHLGYPMDKTPLGGGAMVGLQLIRHWARMQKVRLSVIGSGPEAPSPDVPYLQLPAASGSPDLVRMSEGRYARFCREFESAVTRRLMEDPHRSDPSQTALVVNDLSESPDLTALSEFGYPIVSLWHVDVVDFFNRIYLGDKLSPERLTKSWEWLECRGLARVFPDVLRLVFQKQRAAVRNARLLVVPSRRMADTLRRCYPGTVSKSNADAPGILVLPWGGWDEPFSAEEIEIERERLAEAYGLRPDTLVLMTLSRISPEKGIHYLLEALRILEDDENFKWPDVRLLICGEPAFMRGPAYHRKVRTAAGRLRRTRVIFPGYLSPPAKKAHFRLADLFVSPSVHESYGLTLVEAMREGLPVLASDHYGVEEIVGPSCGRSVAFGNSARRASNLADGIKDLLSDPRSLEAMGAQSRSTSEGMRFEQSAGKLLDAVVDTIG